MTGHLEDEKSVDSASSVFKRMTGGEMKDKERRTRSKWREERLQELLEYLTWRLHCLRRRLSDRSASPSARSIFGTVLDPSGGTKPLLGDGVVVVDHVAVDRLRAGWLRSLEVGRTGMSCRSLRLVMARAGRERP